MVIKIDFIVHGHFKVCEVHMFSAPVSQQLWEGKRDRQIYRIYFTFNLRQKREEEIVLQLHCCLSLQRKIKTPEIPREDKMTD